MPLLKLFSRKVLFDFTPKHSYRITVFAFEPSGALSVRVSSADHIRVMGVTLTREEGEQLARALATWVVSDET